MTSQKNLNLSPTVNDSDVGHMQLTAKLVFDSFRELSPSGVRSNTSGVRYLLYQAGPFVIELRLECTTGSQHYSITGQVHGSDEGSDLLDRLPVHLRSDKDELALTMTNHFGEFSLEYETRGNVHVCVTLDRQKDIIIPLDESFWRVTATPW